MRTAALLISITNVKHIWPYLLMCWNKKKRFQTFRDERVHGFAFRLAQENYLSDNPSSPIYSSPHCSLPQEAVMNNGKPLRKRNGWKLEAMVWGLHASQSAVDWKPEDLTNSLVIYWAKRNSPELESDSCRIKLVALGQFKQSEYSSFRNGV